MHDDGAHQACTDGLPPVVVAVVQHHHPSDTNTLTHTHITVYVYVIFFCNSAISSRVSGWCGAGGAGLFYAATEQFHFACAHAQERGAAVFGRAPPIASRSSHRVRAHAARKYVVVRVHVAAAAVFARGVWTTKHSRAPVVFMYFL